MSIIDSIKECPLFLELYDEEIEAILNDCVVVSFEEGHSIMNEKDEGKDFYVLLSGEATVSKEIRGKIVKINELKKGDVFGETVLINENQRLTSVMAQTKCDVLVVDHHTIFSMFEKNTKVFAILILNLSRMLTKRLRSSNKAISQIHERLKKTG